MRVMPLGREFVSERGASCVGIKGIKGNQVLIFRF